MVGTVGTNRFANLSNLQFVLDNIVRKLLDFSLFRLTNLGFEFEVYTFPPFFWVCVQALLQHNLQVNGSRALP